MPDQETVWLARIIQKDAEANLSLVLVRGVFRDEDEARRLASPFGCDAIIFAKPGQHAELGGIALVALSQVGAEG